MFTLKFYLTSMIFFATIVQKDGDTHNILLQNCFNHMGCYPAGYSISYHLKDPNFAQGDHVKISGKIKCHSAFGIDETEKRYYSSYKMYICQADDLNISKVK